jgi:hypothetical protein
VTRIALRERIATKEAVRTTVARTRAATRARLIALAKRPPLALEILRRTFAELRLSPRAGRYGDEQDRLMSCPFSVDCLDLAVLEKWPALTCSACRAFLAYQSADDAWREMVLLSATSSLNR